MVVKMAVHRPSEERSERIMPSGGSKNVPSTFNPRHVRGFRDPFRGTSKAPPSSKVSETFQHPNPTGAARAWVQLAPEQGERSREMEYLEGASCLRISLS